jgi:hypothetical protein
VGSQRPALVVADAESVADEVEDRDSETDVRAVVYQFDGSSPRHSPTGTAKMIRAVHEQSFQILHFKPAELR